MMRILLLGAGYVGEFLLKSWSGDDQFVATTTTSQKLDRLNRHPCVERAQLLHSQEKESLKGALDSCQGLIVTVAPRKGDDYENTYLKSAQSIKSICNTRKSSLYILVTSSTSVYGEQSGRLVNEKTPKNPIKSSSQILSETEEVYLSLSSVKIQVCILRLGGIYGPKRSLERRAQQLSHKNMPGNGQEPSNHIHLEDITRGIEFCVQNKLHGIYNLVNNSHPLRYDLYNTLSQHLNLAPPIWQDQKTSGFVTNACVSNQKILNCGFSLKHPHITPSIAP